MREIGRDEFRRLLEEGVQLVDVLPAEEYAEEHVAGAVSIPLDELGDRAVKELARDRPVVVYCFDSACDLSPRAARRLVSLGFTDVYDYVAGKADWAAAGLPTQGRGLAEPRLADVALPDVPRCRADEPLDDVAGRLGEWEVAVVVDEDDVVLGLLSRKRLDLDGDHVVEEVMREGPSTYRPNVPVTELAERFDAHGVHRALVTSSGGKLIGLVRREDLQP